MDLFERMKDICGEEICPFGLRIQLLGFKNLGIFGSGKVSFISDENIVFASKNCEVAVFGAGLKIMRSEPCELYIIGEIEKIERKNI
ncbi:MAG: YabP/YqfC family sporulation protein [Bacillota bacterium]